MSFEEQEPREEAAPAEQERQPAPPAEELEAEETAPVAELAGEREEGEEDRAEKGRPAPGERRRRQFGRRRVCAFCTDKVRVIDYKDAAKLRRYLSDRGRIEARRKTGTCAKHQRWLALALKRARHLALLPYTPEHIRTTGMFAARR